MKPALSLRPTTTLALTPALRHALQLLQMSGMELQHEVHNALETNYLLEAMDGYDNLPADGDTQPGDLHADDVAVDPRGQDEASDPDWDNMNSMEGPGAASGPADAELQAYLEANRQRPETLHEHLEWQVHTAPLDSLDTQIALALVDAIDDDGYLQGWEQLLTDLCTSANVDTAHVEAVLRQVQCFDPTGVGARNLRECLCLQLEQTEARQAQAARQLLAAPMADIARRDIAALARATKLTQETVSQALELLVSLQPHPGQPWQHDNSNYIEPDLITTPRGSGWQVNLNPSRAPQLRINPQYRSLIKKSGEDRNTLQQHLQQARSLIHGLKARNATLLRVGEFIVRAQHGFLEYGATAMRPLVLADAAEALELHASTISRALANKYIFTPRGTTELRYFFSSHVNTREGGSCSAIAVQAMIKQMIGDETTRHPLTDTALSRMLNEKGIQIARRTVAKYRERLKISPAHQRRIMASGARKRGQNLKSV